jgi:pantoate--beta-alanine ligase
MEVITERLPLIALAERLKREGREIGFVPTMGALHEGHLSLVRRCRQENGVAVASVFVNPTQFNDEEDLRRYPRTPERDFELLEGCGCDYVFAPGVSEVYPEVDTRVFSFGYAEEVMEGARRPGHFNGVAQVVSKFFDMIGPRRAYFGQKDFQQVAIIRQLVERSGYDVEIVTCPIVREPDGLAMSSRNMLLPPACRKNVPHVFRTLQGAIELAHSLDVERVKEWTVGEIDRNPYLRTDYFEVVDSVGLHPVRSWNEEGVKIGCVAVFAGDVRLIDNVVIA